MSVLTLVFSLLLAATLIKCQCTVSTETIVSSSSSEEVCAVVSTESLTYTCTNNDNDISWSSTVWSGTFTVVAGGSIMPPMLNVNGVTLMESNNNNETCLSSTLTFSGSLAALTQLNNATLSCGVLTAQVDMPIVVPNAPDPPLLINVPSITCNTSGNQVTLQWTPPTNTGGQGVMIDHYLLTVSGPAGYTCPPDQCNVTTTSTTISGLECGSSYNVSVRAVNCRNTSVASNTIMFNLNPPGKPLFDKSCIDDDDLAVNWTVAMNSENVCGFTLSFNLMIFDTTDSSLVLNTTTNSNYARVPVNGSNYDVTISAFNGCGAGPDAFTVINTTCTTPTSSVPPSTSVSPTATSTMTPIPGPTNLQVQNGIGVIAGGAAGGIIVVALLSALIGFILGCVCCPCLACCLLCRKKLCGCCPQSWICCGPYRDSDEYGEPTPLQEKQPVLQSFSTETKEKDVETGQPSYPSSAGPTYQDPSTIQRTAGPTGDLYAQPEKPARHQKQKPPPPPMEMATYQDPDTIVRTVAPSGDLYAQPDKPPKQPTGPAPVYSEVNKSNPEGLVYADLTHSEPPTNARRREQVPDTTVYSEVSRH